jgi:hypothetical protein
MHLLSSRTGTVDAVGRWLLRVAAVTAVVAAVASLSSVRQAGTQTVVVEVWRLYGLVAFAGLFLILSARPRGNRVLWAVTLGSKALLAMTGIALLLHTPGNAIPGAGDLALSDGMLALVLVAAFWCCRGWVRDEATPRSRSER